MENYQPIIGKNVIETLTEGMYEESRIIYREYIQNAADQIDIAVEEGILKKKNDGIIKINIDKAQKRIVIEDNATGIKAGQVLEFLGDVAKSPKDSSKRKGFRGIGRLGGLGYCNKLVFETSYKGEPHMSRVILDAKQLKRIIADKNNNLDASAVISVITSIEQSIEDAGKHYFKVVMEAVHKDILLDLDNVRDYLSMVAPVPFSEDFNFAGKIYEYFDKNNVAIEEYNIFLNGNKPLCKAYSNIVLDKDGEPFSELLDVQFFKFKNNDSELLALGWYGISGSLNRVMHKKNIDRGIRIKKNNITIGGEDTLNMYFPEDKYNHHFKGEIHVTGSGFIPNARRDFFNDNATLKRFVESLYEKFSNFYSLSHTSSQILNRYKEIREYQEGKSLMLSSDENSRNDINITDLRKRAISAKNKLEKIKKKSVTDTAIGIVYKHIVNDSNLIITNEPEPEVVNKKSNYLSKLNNDQKTLVLEIFSIIETNLPASDSLMLKNKIIEKYS